MYIYVHFYTTPIAPNAPNTPIALILLMPTTPNTEQRERDAQTPIRQAWDSSACGCV